MRPGHRVWWKGLMFPTLLVVLRGIRSMMARIWKSNMTFLSTRRNCSFWWILWYEKNPQTFTVKHIVWDKTVWCGCRIHGKGPGFSVLPVVPVWSRRRKNQFWKSKMTFLSMRNNCIPMNTRGIKNLLTFTELWILNLTFDKNLIFLEMTCIPSGQCNAEIQIFLYRHHILPKHVPQKFFKIFSFTT